MELFFSFLKYLNKHYNVVTVPFTIQAHVDMAEKFAVMKFRKPSRRANGGTDVGLSIKQAQKKYIGDYVFVVLSDFQTNSMPSELFAEKRTFCVCLKEDVGTMTSFETIPAGAKYVIE